ncbi:hypothetical protein K3495_g10123 [Podosphaera aphanis]|nr:hypothetical protein K3495_g10123 [Podosphaera aphanis]
MQFLHVENNINQPVEALRLNWYYRPKDIGRKVNDTRQVFASMHSDISPLTSLRGKCQIKHKSEVDNLDELRKQPNSFWYEKLYDRYIHRFYDVIPTSQVINVPVEVKKVLDDRWKFILVEPGRGKELTSAVKSCKRCNKYCAIHDSVDCAVCESTYHMSCISPPLLKKPSRGFAWACGTCSKAQEKKLEARNTPNINHFNIGDEDELMGEETDSPVASADLSETSPTCSRANVESEIVSQPGTAEQIEQASLWLFRYLGIHCNVEDVLDYDDRIYPRASSRLGPRHQANIHPWYGRPVEYVKPPESKKKSAKGGNNKKDSKLSKEILANQEALKNAREARPKWVMDEPVGYVHRGEDYNVADPRCTSQLLYKFPEPNKLPNTLLRGRKPEDISASDGERYIFEYMGRAAGLAKTLGLPPLTTNLLDIALEILHTNDYDSEKALDALSKVDRTIFKEPELTASETKKFEDGVVKFGSEWHSIKKHVKSVPSASIVRFYYTWKKTERGKQVWGNYVGRKGKKEAKKEKAEASNSGIKLQDDIADEHDDSAFDNDKAFRKKKGFQCKFCNTKSSRQWRRAPNAPSGCTILENATTKGSAKDKGSNLVIALCRRCAELWRRYAIQWEDVDEVAKKIAQTGGRTWKRKIDEELLKELAAANEVNNCLSPPTSKNDVSAAGTPAPTTAPAIAGQEPPRKKSKVLLEKEDADLMTEATFTTQKKKSSNEKNIPVSPHVSPPPEPPKPKIMPCAVCGEIEPFVDQHVSCKDCRMAVHRNCYGIVGDSRNSSKWTCDMCSNDKNPQVSIQYKCVLCPIEFTEKDFAEPTRLSHKKKTERERERDRIEREHAQEVANYYRNKQIELNKPVNPREPLKRTANNNWVHVTCAVFTPEVKFGNAKALEPSEGIPSIPVARYAKICKVCKKNNRGACVNCPQCRTSVHVECANQAGYVLGFDITPVKGSRRDQLNTVNINDEVGTMTAAIWCKDHVPSKANVYRMHHSVDGLGLNTLQLYVRNFKQADLALTGTVRKANLINLSSNVLATSSASHTSNRRTSTNQNGITTSTRSAAASQARMNDSLAQTPNLVKKRCLTCDIDVSPRWWPYLEDIQASILPMPHTISTEDHHESLRLLDVSAANSDSIPSQSIIRESSAALAAAVLDQGTPGISRFQKAKLPSKQYQCHKCHWNKVRKEPVPLKSICPSSTVPILTSTQPSKMKSELTMVQSPYQWPMQSSPYTPNNITNGQQSHSWSHHSPTAQNVPIPNQTCGSLSPSVGPGTVQNPYLSRPPIRHQPSPGLHQNGQICHMTNGYPSFCLPPGSSSQHVQDDPYATYSSSRPQTLTSQHLISPGAPPRPLESPFLQASTLAHQQQQQQPGVHHDGTSLRSEPNSRIGDPDVSPNDGRFHGGASASPSLRNLLH